MPIYEYQCTKGHKHDYLCHVDNRDNERLCPECKQPCKALISPVATTFTYADKSPVKRVRV